MSNKILDAITELKNAKGTYTDLKTYIETKTGQQIKDWNTTKAYNKDEIVIYSNFFYKCIATTVSTIGTFVAGEWSAIGNSASSLTAEQMTSINSIPTLTTNVTNHFNNKLNPHEVSLNQIKDVTITTPTDKQVMGYDANTSKWVNQTVSTADEKVKASASGISGYMDSIVDGTTCVIDNNKLVIKTLSGLTVDIVNLNTLSNMTTNVKDTFSNYIPTVNISESLTSTSTTTVPSSNAIKTLSETINTNYVAKSNITDSYNTADKTLVASQYAVNQLALLIGALQGGLIWKGGIDGTTFKALTSWQAGYLYKATDSFEVGTTSISMNALIVFKTTVTSGGIVSNTDFDVFVSATEFSHTGIEIDKATTMTLDADFTKLGWVDIDTCDLSFDSNRIVHVKPKLPATATHLYINSIRIILDSEITVQIPNATGIYYITMSGAKVLSYGSTIDYNDYTQMPICFIRYDSTKGVRTLVDLRVSNLLMDAPTRAYIYNNGTQWQSGFEMQDFAINIAGSPNKLCQFSLTDGQIRQSEKLITYKNVATPTNPYENILTPFTSKLYYILGNSYTNDDLSSVCLKKGTTRPCYNKLNSSTNNFEVVEVEKDKYFAILVGVDTDIRAGYSAIAIMGQHTYSSIDECKIKENFSTISLADFNLKNTRFLYGIVFHANEDLYFNDYYAKAVGYLDVRNYIVNKSLADSAGDSLGGSSMSQVNLISSSVISGDRNTVYYVKSGSNGTKIVLPNTNLTPQDKIRVEDTDGLLGDTFSITVDGQLPTINNEQSSLLLNVAYATVEFEWTGSTWLVKFYGNMITPELTTKLMLPSSTASMASINFANGVDPTLNSQSVGDAWFTSDNTLKFKDNNGDSVTINAMVGEIRTFAGQPSYYIGWLPCLGQEVSKTQYQRLYNCIGDTWGTTTDNTKFKLPDYRKRNIIGYDPSDVNFAIGKSGGTSSVTLSITNLPPHDHSNGSFNKLMTVDGTNTMGSTGTDASASEVNLYKQATIATVGSGTPFSVQNPYGTACVMIKY